MQNSLIKNQKNLKISLFGNFGTLNLGNECTLEAMIYNIRKYKPKASINSICSNPKDVSVRHKIEAFSISCELFKNLTKKLFSEKSNLILKLLRLLLVKIPSEIFEWIRAIIVLRDRHYLIMTGTGMLSDHGDSPLGFPYQIFKWTIAAKLCNLKVYFVSVGAESINYALSKLLIKASLKKADYISYRDNHSKKYMNDLGINVECKIYPDLAFSLPENIFPNTKERDSNRTTIGIGLYDYHYNKNSINNLDKKFLDYMDKICILILWLLRRGYYIHILIGDIKYDNQARDILKSYLNVFLKKYDKELIIDNPISTVKQLIEQINETELVIATRFHNVLLATMLNKPVISIGYDIKNDALMKAFGLEQYCQRIDDFNIHRLICQFNELKKIAKQYKHYFVMKNNENRKLLDEQYKLILHQARSRII